MKKQVLKHLKRLVIASLICFGLLGVKTLVMYSRGVEISTIQLQNAIQGGIFFSIWLYANIEIIMVRTFGE